MGEHTSQFAEKEESFANRFASNLLMPEEPLKLAVAAQRNERRTLGYNDLFEIARQFDVSVIAVLWRMVGMKLIERVKAEEMRKAVQNRVEIWEKRKTDAPLRRPVRFEALAREAIEKGQISTGKFAEYMGISRRAAMTLIESEINIVKEDGGYAQVEIVDP